LLTLTSFGSALSALLAFGDSLKNLVNAALLKQALQHQERAKDKRVFDGNIFGKIENGQNILVFADGVEHFLHAVFAGTTKGQEGALFDFTVLAVGLNKVVVPLPGLICRGSNVHDTSNSRLLCCRLEKTTSFQRLFTTLLTF
jgi:hypothetical protein